MKKEFVIYSILLIVAQILFWGMLNISPFFVLALLPVIVLCFPVHSTPVQMMITAFVLGLIVDFLSTGNLGLTSIAIVPVALIRNFVIELVTGSGIIDRQESISFKRMGAWKMLLCLMLCYALFFLVFVWVDGAGMRSFWFNLGRFFLSWSVSVLVALPISSVLTRNNSGRWR